MKNTMILAIATVAAHNMPEVFSQGIDEDAPSMMQTDNLVYSQFDDPYFNQGAKNMSQYNAQMMGRRGMESDESSLDSRRGSGKGTKGQLDAPADEPVYEVSRHSSYSTNIAGANAGASATKPDAKTSGKKNTANSGTDSSKPSKNTSNTIILTVPEKFKDKFKVVPDSKGSFSKAENGSDNYRVGIFTEEKQKDGDDKYNKVGELDVNTEGTTVTATLVPYTEDADKLVSKEDLAVMNKIVKEADSKTKGSDKKDSNKKDSDKKDSDKRDSDKKDSDKKDSDKKESDSKSSSGVRDMAVFGSLLSAAFTAALYMF